MTFNPIYNELRRIKVNKTTVTIAAAAMLAGLLLTGCHSSSATGGTSGGQTTPELSNPSGGGSCNHWPGVSALQGAYTSLQFAASQTPASGPEDPGDAAAVNIQLTLVSSRLDQSPLPTAWDEA